MKSAICLLAILLTACSTEPLPTRMEDINLAKLDGIESRCAKATGNSAYESIEVSKLMSVGGATETIGAVVDAIESEIERCIVNVYLMGIEDGRKLEREVY